MSCLDSKRESGLYIVNRLLADVMQNIVTLS